MGFESVSASEDVIGGLNSLQSCEGWVDNVNTRVSQGLRLNYSTKIA